MPDLLHFNYHFKKWFSTKASTEGDQGRLCYIIFVITLNSEI